MKNKDVIKKFFETPGLCSKEEIFIVEEFIISYKQHRDTYKECVGYYHGGLTLESNLDKIKWYKNWFDNNTKEK